MNEKIITKLKDLIRITIYFFALVGSIVSLAYIYEINHESRKISLLFIKQVFMYTGVGTIGIIIFISDIFFERLSNVLRITFLFVLIYILGLVYFFQCPINPFGSFLSFFATSFFIIFLSACFLIIWIIYQYAANKKYDYFIEQYKKNH